MPARPKMLLIGATSMLGWSILRHPEAAGWDIAPCVNRHNRDPRARAWIRVNAEEPGAWRFVGALAPDVVVHCGGICDVDRCEAHPEFAWAINVDGVTALLRALPVTTRLVYGSSDHVFGDGATPFCEASEPRAISVYGRTRVEAERRVLAARPDVVVVRIGLPIGPSFDGRRGHLDWLRHRHARGLPMTVIADERRSAVWARDAAQRVLALASSETCGIRHLVASRAVTRPALARALCRRLELEPRYDIEHRRNLTAPHLGNVELTTVHDDLLAAPLPCPLDNPTTLDVRASGGSTPIG